MKRNNRIAFLVCCFLLLTACEKKEEKIVRPVSVYVVQENRNFFEVKFPAVAEAGKEVQLSFKVSGIIEEIPYEIGAFVQQGQLLAKMDNRDYIVGQNAAREKMLSAQNAYLGAKAQADNARRQFARLQALYRENALAKKKYDDAKAMVEGAAAKEKAGYAAYMEAKQGYINKENQNKDTVLFAPYSGYVKHKFADAGSVVSSGMPVLTFSSAGKKKVQINISQNDMKYFAEQSGYVFKSHGKEYSLILQTVGKVKQSLDLVYPVVFYFENDEEILVGTEGSVHVQYEDKEEGALLVPVEAVFDKDGQACVWIFDGDSVHKKAVTVMRAEQDGMLSVKNLSAGEAIVVKGVHELYEGQEVRALEDFSETNIGRVL